MSAARKQSYNPRPMSRESRTGAYAAMNILWLKMRPDLRFEDKQTIRDERLTWITSFLGLEKDLKTAVDLTDGQIGLVLDEMKRMTGSGNTSSPQTPVNQTTGNVVSLQQFKLQHYGSEEQKYTLGKIILYLKWTDEQTSNFLKKRKFGESIEKISFKNANSLTMILLNIAADKDLRILGEKKVSRKMTAEYIPLLKKKLQIGS